MLLLANGLLAGVRGVSLWDVASMLVTWWGWRGALRPWNVERERLFSSNVSVCTVAYEPPASSVCSGFPPETLGRPNFSCSFLACVTKNRPCPPGLLLLLLLLLLVARGGFISSPPKDRLIVANTHLYFHPSAAHIRLMQLVALVERWAHNTAALRKAGQGG